ncbi:EthD domain-containing protein [Aspergillus karnatakaensis]|uniref:EthD domain-containing protein n=1 Tax=Aspergillus karnatakaensis TaxID=1810916 RepID=UPI003CCD8E60
MPIKALILSSRKPGLSLEEFRTHYEEHVQLIKSLAGDTFPLSHRRTYLARTTVNTPTGDGPGRNALIPAIVVRGEQSDFDFDATAELTFADQDAADKFMERMGQRENAQKLLEDEEKFLNRERVAIVMIRSLQRRRFRGTFHFLINLVCRRRRNCKYTLEDQLNPTHK